MKAKEKSCEICDTTFEYKRKSSKYCSSKCRKTAYRRNNPDKIRGENRKNYEKHVKAYLENRSEEDKELDKLKSKHIQEHMKLLKGR